MVYKDRKTLKSGVGWKFSFDFTGMKCILILLFNYSWSNKGTLGEHKRLLSKKLIKKIIQTPNFLTVVYVCVCE